MTSAPLWLTTTPLFYDGSPQFLQRESGLLCIGFNRIGISSRLVLLNGTSPAEGLPVQTCTLSQMEDARYWREQRATGVVFYSWASPRYTRIAQAIHASGTPLIIKLDSDGLKSPRVSWPRYVCASKWAEEERGHWFPGTRGFLRASLKWLFPGIHDAKMIQHMECADVIGIETPFALQMLRRLLFGFGRQDLARRLRVIPHPVDAVDRSVRQERERLIVAVGRWGTVQKDPQMLMMVLQRVLATRPDYRAEFFGSGEEILEKLCRSMPCSVRARIAIQGPVKHDELLERVGCARISFMPSRWEGFPNSAAEALCMGTSVVGAADTVSSMVYFTGHASGTATPKRWVQGLCDALLTEIWEWEEGRRDPVAIAAVFREDLLVENIVRKISAMV